MIMVEQALYGDKQGAYALLKTSIVDTDIAIRVCNVTDVLDRPLNGHLENPVFRGFHYNDLYLLIKSFPDNDPSVRQGRVLSHALIVKHSDLAELNDLAALCAHFIPEPDKTLNLSTLILDLSNCPKNCVVENGSREASAINGLLNHSEHKNIIVWTGEEDYFAFISKIWCKLSSDLKYKLKLGIGFNPPKEAPQNVCIFYVPEGYENRWRSKGCCIVDKNDFGTLSSMGAFYLGGHQDLARPLEEMINTFGIKISEIDDYSYLDKAVEIYNNLEQTPEFNRIIVLCDLISKFSPDSSVANDEKIKLLNQLLGKIRSASVKQILTLKNPDWRGFPDATVLIGEQISNWVAGVLFNLDVDLGFSTLISSALDSDNKAFWWGKSISNSLRQKFKEWQSSYAVVLWKLFTLDYNSIFLMADLIPNNAQVENDFIKYCPNPLNKEVSICITTFAKKRKWLTLYGVSNLNVHSAEISIIAQLAIDTDAVHYSSLRTMGEMINSKEFIRIAVSLGETRLVHIAGEIVSRDTSLLDGIDVYNKFWLKIWLKSITDGNNPWTGITKPQAVLFSLLEQVLNDNEIEPTLLNRLSISEYNDLANLNQRASLWRKLGPSEKSGFLRSTALGCVKLLDNNNSKFSDFETEIRTTLLEENVIHTIFGDSSIRAATKIILTEQLPGLQENDIIFLFKSDRFSPEESECLGRFIAMKKWRAAAKVVVDLAAARPDCRPALLACKSLLGIFERINLSILGILSDSISEDEWWAALTEQCYEKYPSGPMHNGLWERVGGKKYDLLSKGTGREIWIDAISHLRKGKLVDKFRLLDEMISEFSLSDDLKKLRKYQR